MVSRRFVFYKGIIVACMHMWKRKLKELSSGILTQLRAQSQVCLTPEPTASPLHRAARPAPMYQIGTL